MCNKDCQQMYLENLKVFSYFFWYFENLSLLRINAAAPFEAVTRCHLVLVLHSFQIWGSKGQIHLFVLLLFLKYGQSVFSSKQLEFFIGPESDHWECLSLTHSLTDWLTDWLLFSKLDWCDPGIWRWHLKTCWGCYCCSCW